MRRNHEPNDPVSCTYCGKKFPGTVLYNWKKSAISKVQKSSICIFKNGKKLIFAPEKSLKQPKILFFSVLKLHF